MTIWTFFIFLIEFIALLVGIYNCKNLSNSKLKYFPYFLCFIFLGEVGAMLIAKIYRNNIFYYNIFTAIQIVFYLDLIRIHISSKGAKNFVLISIIAFILSTIINILYIQHALNEWVCYTFTLGCFLITVWVTYYFYELLDSDKVDNYGKEPMFWIGIGLFIFYVCNIPYMSIFNYLQSNYNAIFNAYYKIIQILSYVMYSFFIIGISCSTKRK
jgi:hypothetical protein